MTACKLTAGFLCICLVAGCAIDTGLGRGERVAIFVVDAASVDQFVAAARNRPDAPTVGGALQKGLEARAGFVSSEVCTVVASSFADRLPSADGRIPVTEAEAEPLIELHPYPLSFHLNDVDPPTLALALLPSLPGYQIDGGYIRERSGTYALGNLKLDGAVPVGTSGSTEGRAAYFDVAEPRAAFVLAQTPITVIGPAEIVVDGDRNAHIAWRSTGIDASFLGEVANAFGRPVTDVSMAPLVEEDLSDCWPIFEQFYALTP